VDGIFRVSWVVVWYGGFGCFCSGAVSVGFSVNLGGLWLLVVFGDDVVWIVVGWVFLMLGVVSGVPSCSFFSSIICCVGTVGVVAWLTFEGTECGVILVFMLI